MTDLRPKSPLPPGTIAHIAQLAGISINPALSKCPVRCPFHADTRPSAFLSPRNNIFYCSVCTPDKAMLAKEFARRLNVSWPVNPTALGTLRPARLPNDAGDTATPASSRAEPSAVVNPAPRGDFTPAIAQEIWSAAFSLARDDRRPQPTAPYTYLRSRGLEESWELNLVGVLTPATVVPDCVRHWERRGYCLLCPLYDSNGTIAGVQARAVVPRDPKIMTPKGCKTKGMVFANSAALARLRNPESAGPLVIVGEGLTDFLALSIATQLPVISAPGAGMAVRCFSEWTRGAEIVLATDVDPAGEQVVRPAANQAFAHEAARVWRIRWPKGMKDACDVVKQRGMQGLRGLLQRRIEGRHG